MESFLERRLPSPLMIPLPLNPQSVSEALQVLEAGREHSISFRGRE